MRSKMSAFFSFLLIVAAVILVLKAMNWLPLMFQTDTLRRYGSVEEVKAKLNIRDLSVPSYFPQSITWPPSEILAQTRPFPAVFMKFTRAGKGDAVLTICQAASENFSPDTVIRIVQIKEKVPYRLNGRDALLEVGVCERGEPCSRISWSDERYKFVMLMKSPPFELIKIAESMRR